MEENLPEKKKCCSKPVLVCTACFLVGALVGAGVFYLYAVKVLVPKYQAKMISEMFSESSQEWGDFFKKMESEEGEFTNPFETSEETGGEDYINPFDLLEE